jgi:uncharacterized membrane protein YfcA
MNEHLLLIEIIIVAAVFIRSLFGFGDGLIAMPLLSLLLGPRDTAVLVAWIGLIIAGILLFKNMKHIDLKGSARILVSAFFGVPLGVFFLKELDDEIIQSLLALILILFSLFKLQKAPRKYSLSHRSTYLFGFIAGLIGGAYNTNGPPLVIYGTLKNWDRDRFRANLQSCMLPLNLFIIISHGCAGLWNLPTARLFLLSLPLVLVAIFLGNFLAQKFHPEKFDKAVYILLLFIGFFLLWKSLSGH